MITLTYGSLFSGAGGFDIGFDNAGWLGRWQVEKDNTCLGILQEHWPSVPKYNDVRSVSGSELGPVDAILFGFPCQDVSNVGSRIGFQGNESVLFFEAIRIIKEMQDATQGLYPRYAVAENVVGLLSAEYGHSYARVLESLVGLGAMAIEWRVLDAQDFGLPQRRRRIFLVANFNLGAECGGTIFPQPKSLSRHSPSNAKPIRSYPEDASSSSHAAVDGHIDFQPLAFSHTAGVDIQVSPHVIPTLKAQGRGQAVFLQNGGTDILRRLVPLECERAQGWPDFHTSRSFGKPVSDVARYRIIGNGVAAPVAEWVATQIQAYDDASSLPSEPPRSP